MQILALNCGSSSVKWELFEVDSRACVPRAGGSVDDIGSGAAVPTHGRETGARDDAGYATAVVTILDGLLRGAARIDAVGHRVVQGGSFIEPALIDDRVLDAIARAAELAPLHNRPSLEGIRAARARLGAMPMVAVFDTAFHATLPPFAAKYAIPDEVARSHGLRRYGYHGIAHRSMTEGFARLTGTPLEDVSLITLQLGSGCSATAVNHGRSVDTSMGFTPLEGLMMGTRSGDIDAAAVLYLQDNAAMSADDVNDLLNARSGLLGVSGRSADMRELLRAEADGDARAHLAVEMFCYRVRKYIGAYLAVLGRPQAVVFGGGIGERSPEVRRRVCEPLAPLGLRIDAASNAAIEGDGRFDAPGSPIAAYVIRSDEESIIARDTYKVLSRTRVQP